MIEKRWDANVETCLKRFLWTMGTLKHAYVIKIELMSCSQKNQRWKEHLMLKVMNRGTICFHTLGRVVCIGFLCVVNGRQQDAGGTRWGSVDPNLRAPWAYKCWIKTKVSSQSELSWCGPNGGVYRPHLGWSMSTKTLLQIVLKFLFIMAKYFVKI